MQEVLENDFILGALNGLNMKPGGGGQPLHMDQEDSTGPLVVTVNVLHILDDFTEENGATRLVPRSHLQTWPRRGHAAGEEERERAIQITAPAGSVIAYSGGILHAGSPNRSASPRRALHAFYCRNWVLPHWDFRKSLPKAVLQTLSEEEKKLFGFYHRPDWYDAFAGKKQRGRITDPIETVWTRLRRRIDG
jgi:ectoine hydroxylase-related dioxygenase (phytanoyl-CoA dioxygenase family)